jgi:hypothetical protein
VEALVRQTGRDLDGTRAGVRQSPETLTSLGGIAHRRKAADGAGDDVPGSPASAPCHGELEAFAQALPGHDHPLDERSDALCALGHRGRGGMPEGRHIVREGRHSLPLCCRQALGLRLRQALILLLPVAVGHALGFPLLGQLSGHQAMFGLAQAGVAGGPFGRIGRPLQALLPPAVEGLPLLLEARRRLPREGERGRCERGEDPLTDEGLAGLTRELRARVAPSVGGQAIPGVAMPLAWSPIAPLPPAVAPATHQ